MLFVDHPAAALEWHTEKNTEQEKLFNLWLGYLLEKQRRK